MRNQFTMAMIVGIAICPLRAYAQETPATPPSESTVPVKAPATDGKTAFKIKFLAEDMVYIDAGRAAGLKPGMKLEVKRAEDPAQAATPGPKTISELEVASVAESSAVCNIVKEPTDPLMRGDSVFLSDADAEAMVQQRALSGMRSYPQTITFTDGDPMEEEYREAVPRPQLPEVNRFQGRIGTDFSGIWSHQGLGSSNTQIGMVFNANITRLLGTYWNVNGYWRGRLSQSAPGGQQSIQDLINRTYHLGMTYENPKSRWVAGIGRLYLPWANSLDTIDGGYVGRRLSNVVTAGIFAGSTPDPTSWSYNPDRRIAGSFVNFTAGSYDAVHFTSTSGLALNTIQWRSDRPFIFFENSISYKQMFSLYSSQMADNPRSVTGTGRIGSGISKSFVSLRFSPARRFTFDLNHNYFRDVPTFDVRLIGTGLLDKYLFQGFSGGVRVETWRRVTVYANVGRSSASGDMKASLNEMYGVSSGPIWKTGLRADVRYSRYDSSFGKGNYRALLLSRNIGDQMRIEAQIGKQSLVSQYTQENGTRFVNILTDMNLGRRFFVQGGFSMERGAVTNYDQWSTTLGYRFDNRATRRDGR
jgi:hypothetical protein